MPEVVGLNTSHLGNLHKNAQQILKMQGMLASGVKLQQASDGPAALVLSQQLDSALTTLRQGSETIQRQSAMIDRAEGGLAQTSQLLGRARELSLAAANTTFSEAEQDALQIEMDAVLNEVDRIGQTTDFAGQDLLQGDFALSVPGGEGSPPVVFPRATTDALGASSESGANLSTLFAGGGQSLLSNPSNATTVIDAALSEVHAARGRLGSASSQILASTDAVFEQSALSLQEAYSRLVDTDVAQTTAELTARQVQLDIQTALQVQTQSLQRDSLFGLLQT